MNTSYKNLLQEYCQKNKIPLPIYRFKKRSGPDHVPKFQFEVEVNGQRYVGRDQCSTIKEAEQLAAKKAWKSLVASKSKSISIRSFSHILTEQPQLRSSRVKCESIEHLPIEYAGIELFIVNLVGIFGGRIKNICMPDVLGRYKIEITGSYRYCENIKKHHKKSQIYFLVDPIKKIFYQKCYHKTCLGFRSSKKKIIIDEQELYVQNENNIVKTRRNCGKQVKCTKRN